MKKSVASVASTTSVASTITVGVDTTMTHTRFNMRTGRNEKIGLIYKPNADYVRHQLERGKTPEELAKQFKMPPTAIHTMGHTEQAKKWWKEAGRKAAAKNRKMNGAMILKAQMMRERGLNDTEIGKVLGVKPLTIANNIGRNTKARKHEILHDAAMLRNALRDLADREPAV